MKWAASMILSLIRWFTAAVLLLIPDFLTYSVVCADNGVWPVKEMIFDRLGYTFTLISPIAFAFFALSCFLFKRKKSVSEKRADFVTAAAIAVFSAAVFLCVSGGAPSPEAAFSRTGYCLSGSDEGARLAEFFGIPSNGFFTRILPVLLPFEAPAQTAWAVKSISPAAFWAFAASLYFILTVSAKFFAVSRWPLFNLSSGLFLVWILAGWHAAYLFAAGRFGWPPAVFSAGITGFNFLAGIILILIMRRLTVDPLR